MLMLSSPSGFPVAWKNRLSLSIEMLSNWVETDDFVHSGRRRCSTVEYSRFLGDLLDSDPAIDAVALP